MPHIQTSYLCLTTVSSQSNYLLITLYLFISDSVRLVKRGQSTLIVLLMQFFFFHRCCFNFFFSVIYFLGSKPVHFNEFFEKNLIQNLASLLGIDESLIRVVEIVNAAGDSRRRRRDSDDTITVTLEIGDPPQKKVPFNPEETYVPGNSR